MLLYQNYETKLFLTFCPLTLKVEKGSKNASSIFKGNENGGGISIYKSTINQFFKSLVVIQTSGKCL